LNQDDGSTTTRVLAGFQLGWGVRILAFDGSHLELGMIYCRSKGATLENPSWTERSAGHPGMDAAEIHLTVGLGR